MKDISTGLNIAKQQLTNVIGSLEADGYVTKAPDPKDKRAVLVSLTSLGKGMVEKNGRGFMKRSAAISIN